MTRHMVVITVSLVAAVMLVPRCPGAADSVATLPHGVPVRKPAVSGTLTQWSHWCLDARWRSLSRLRSLVSGRSRPSWPLTRIHDRGTILAAVYRQIQGEKFVYDTVILLGPCHDLPTKAAAVSSAEAWDTPLGRVPVHTATALELVAFNDRIEFDDKAHETEHALEVQLPYLLEVAEGRPFKIVPVLTNSSAPEDQEILAKALGRIGSRPRTLIVLSTDLSHYPAAASAEKVDRAMLGAVKSMSAKTLVREDRRIVTEGYAGLSVTMCGLEAACVLLRAPKELGITKAVEVGYAHSGMVSGETDRVVGYGGVVFNNGN